MNPIDLLLPKPYPLQVEIAQHTAKRKVIATGRRSGKTTIGAMLAVGGQSQYGMDNGLLDGKRVFLSSTSQDQSDLFWEYICRWLQPLFNHPAFYNG